MGAEQGELNFGDRSKTIQQRFEEFHRKNPMVYRLLCKYARHVLGAGHLRWGLRCIWERMRWEIMFGTEKTDGSSFKLNDHYMSRYARLIMGQEEDLEDFFEIRKLRAK
jgi:hypothetical protein